MTQRVLARNAGIAVGVLAAAGAVPCHAEAYGPPDPQFAFVIGAIVALPVGVACMLVEAILPRRRVPQRVTFASALVGLLCALLLALASRPAFAPLAALAYAWFLLVPVCALLALRGVVANGWIRLLVPWSIAIAMLPAWERTHPHDAGAWGWYGAAGTCLLPWTLAVVVLNLAGLRPPPRAQGAVAFAVPEPLRAAAARAGAAAARESRDLFRELQPAHAGLVWWLGSAALVYFGIGALGSAGWLDMSWFHVELAQLLASLNGSELRVRHPMTAWWLYGIPWSLFAGGAVWGVAATVGFVEAGRARVIRFAAIVAGVVLIAWSWQKHVAVAEVRASEERAMGLRH